MPDSADRSSSLSPCDTGLMVPKMTTPVVDLTTSSPLSEPVSFKGSAQLDRARSSKGDHDVVPVAKRKRSSDKLNTGDTSLSDTATWAHCTCRDGPKEKIPRPMNAFMLYRRHHSDKLISRNKGIGNPDISRMIGKQWREEAESEKDKWRGYAEQEKVMHALKYPDYRYQPGKRPKNTDGPSDFYTWSQGENGFCGRCGGRFNGPPTPVTASAVMPPTPPSDQADNKITAANNSTRPTIEEPRKSSLHLPFPMPSSATTPSTKYLPMLNEMSSRPSQTFSFRPAEGATHTPQSARSMHTNERHFSQDYYKPATAMFQPDHQQFATQQHQQQHPQQHPLVPRFDRRASDALHNHHDSGAKARVRGPSMYNPSYQHRLPAAPHAGGISNIDRRHTIKSHGLTLPPLRTVGLDRGPSQRSASVLETGSMAMLTPVPAGAKIQVSPRSSTVSPLAKANILNSVALPLPITAGHERGLVIAIEGDRSEAAQAVAEWLGKHLMQADAVKSASVTVMDGPTSSSATNVPLDQEKLFDIVKTWHGKNAQLRRTLEDQAPVQHSSEDQQDGSSRASDNTAEIEQDSAKSVVQQQRDTNSSPAVVIFRNYLLSATNQFASQLSLRDLYGIESHWQWTACLWRGMIGPDLLIYIRDFDEKRDGPDAANGVDIIEKPKTMMVRRSRNVDSLDGGGAGGVGAGTLRRVGFEVLEWLVEMRRVMRMPK